MERKDRKKRGIVKYFFLLIGFYQLAFSNTNQKARELLRDFDLAYYRPQVYNLRDFKVDTRIDGLSEKLSQQLIFGKLKDVFFEISWLTRDRMTVPDYSKVKVLGFPDGFVEVRSELSSNVQQRIDFIVPVALSERMKDYELSMTVDKDGTHTVICRDPKNMEDANEIILVFDKKRRLKRFIVKRPMVLETVDLKLVKKSWSQGKWVLSEYNVEKVQGAQKISSNSTFDYTVIAGFGLPERIETVVKQVLTRVSSNKSDTYERESASHMRFSNWRVNTGSKKSDFHN